MCDNTNRQKNKIKINSPSYLSACSASLAWYTKCSRSAMVTWGSGGGGNGKRRCLLVQRDEKVIGK